MGTAPALWQALHTFNPSSSHKTCLQVMVCAHSSELVSRWQVWASPIVRRVGSTRSSSPWWAQACAGRAASRSSSAPRAW